MEENVEIAIREYFASYVANIDDLRAAKNAILDVLVCVYIDFEDELLRRWSNET